MSVQQISADQDFYAPRFEVRLRGQQLSRSAVRDVLEVRYNDSLDKLDSVELTLRDWDPVRNEPQYSSPFDASGRLRTLEGGQEVPHFEPGARLELTMGYHGPHQPRLMLTGEVVSISPSFPSSGNPTVRVRALSLLHTLQRAQEVRTFERATISEVARTLAADLGIDVEIPPGQSDRESRHELVVVNNEYPVIFLLQQARRLGYDLYVKIPEGDGPEVLFFGRTPGSGSALKMTWGGSLHQFSPTLTTRKQVAKVVVRGWNPRAEGRERTITGEATWADLGRELPDPQLLAQIDSALAQTHEQVVDDPIETAEEAKTRAVAILQNLANDLITGRGATVGLPDLRAGRKVVLTGLGLRFSGRYLVTDTTHSIGAGGYQTEFGARLEGSA